MANKKQSPAMIIILIAIVVVAAFFVMRALQPPRPVPIMTNWTCEECDYRFVAPLTAEGTPIECRSCGGMAVRTYYFYCRTCDYQFEAYRVKPPAEEAEVGIAPRPHKIPGGEWIVSIGPPRIVCPICGDYRALEFVRLEPQ